MTVLGSVLIAGGSALLVIAALGLFLLQDALARQHAATKAGTLGLGVLLIGAALVGGYAGWWWRVGLTVIVLMATLPVASHMLARAAARESFRDEDLVDAPIVDADAANRGRR